MKSAFYITLLIVLLGSNTGFGQYMQMTAELSGATNLLIKIKPVGGNLTIGWSDIEFCIRNPDSSTDPGFAAAQVTINTTDFPGISLPYRGKNEEGSETGYYNYKFGTSFVGTTARTYIQNQEYVLCTITTAGFSNTNLELCHNEPNFQPHYIALTDNHGNDVSNLIADGNKFYGESALICTPNCPTTTAGNNHILPIAGTSSVLPVELLDFSVEKNGNQKAMLAWETATEKQLLGFQIERSSDGTNWEKIGLEPAKGSRSNYIYRDDYPPLDIVYYRLNMLEANGGSSYSPVRSLHFGRETDISVYPNPTTGFLQIKWNMEEEIKREIQIFETTGRLIFTTITENKHYVSIDLSHLPAGAYWLRVNSGAQVWSRRVVRL